jgi:hypothetical protein
LTARHVDPASLDLVTLVGALLEEAGYTVAPHGDGEDRVADLEVSAGEMRAMVRCYRCDGHVAARTVDQFGYVFLRSGAGEGFFVTDGLLPFETRHWERDQRIHLLDRVGIQRLVDAVALRSVKPAAAPPGASGAA